MARGLLDAPLSRGMTLTPNEPWFGCRLAGALAVRNDRCRKTVSKNPTKFMYLLRKFYFTVLFEAVFGSQMAVAETAQMREKPLATVIDGRDRFKRKAGRRSVWPGRIVIAWGMWGNELSGC